MTRRVRGRDPLRIHGTIARDLGIAIARGDHQPGDILDGEVEASSSRNVSRTAYREAIRILAAKGLVESRPRTGTRVSARSRWHMLDPDVIAWTFGGEPDETLIQRLFELRRIVEPEAAALAARRRTPAQLAAMKAGAEGMEQHTVFTEEGRAADFAFHEALLAASANPFVISLTSSITAAVGWITEYNRRATARQRDSVPDHWLVYRAIEAGDGQGAHAAMAELIERGFRDTARALQLVREAGKKAPAPQAG